jgi:diadenosine tetraphosphate (Ap4A) HIT family hydrolase
MDERYHPDGYNVGWNCGTVGGQIDMHAHMHVIPRFRQEPYAGRGIRYWMKQPANRW